MECATKLDTNVGVGDNKVVKNREEDLEQKQLKKQAHAERAEERGEEVGEEVAYNEEYKIKRFFFSPVNCDIL